MYLIISHYYISYRNESVLEATSLSADIEKTVRKLEEKLEKEELQNTQIIQKKDVIPLVAEELGSGKACMHVCVCGSVGTWEVYWYDIDILHGRGYGKIYEG